MTNPIRVLQLTDTHLFAEPDGKLLGVKTAVSLQGVIDLALNTKGTPDVVLLTGDLSQDYTPQSYERLQSMVAGISAPKYYLPGNHDDFPLMHEVFGAGGIIDVSRSFTHGNWLVVLLDSTVHKQVAGHLRGAELARLADEIDKNPEKNALICLHHHPIPVDSRWIDNIGVDNGDALMAIVDSRPQVKAVVWGHIHQKFDGRRNDVTLMATPSTCVQFRPRTADFGVDAEPPGFRWIELSSDGSVKSEVFRLAEIPDGLMLSSAGY